MVDEGAAELSVQSAMFVAITVFGELQRSLFLTVIRTFHTMISISV